MTTQTLKKIRLENHSKAEHGIKRNLNFISFFLTMIEAWNFNKS